MVRGGSMRKKFFEGKDHSCCRFDLAVHPCPFCHMFSPPSPSFFSLHYKYLWENFGFGAAAMFRQENCCLWRTDQNELYSMDHLIQAVHAVEVDSTSLASTSSSSTSSTSTHDHNHPASDSQPLPTPAATSVAASSSTADAASSAISKPRPQTYIRNSAKLYSLLLLEQEDEECRSLDEFGNIVNTVRPVCLPEWRKVSKLWNERVQAGRSKVYLANEHVCSHFWDYVQHMLRKKPTGETTMDRWLYNWKVIFQKLNSKTATQHFQSDSERSSDDDGHGLDDDGELLFDINNPPTKASQLFTQSQFVDEQSLAGPPDISQPSTSQTTIQFGSGQSIATTSSAGVNINIVFTLNGSSTSSRAHFGLNRMFESVEPNLASPSTSSTTTANPRSGTAWPPTCKPNTPVSSLQSRKTHKTSTPTSAPKTQPKKKSKAKAKEDNDPYEHATPSSSNTATIAKRNLTNLMLDTLESLNESKADKETAKLSSLLENFLDKTLKSSSNVEKHVNIATTLTSQQVCDQFATKELPAQFLLAMKAKKIGCATSHVVWKQSNANFDEFKSFCLGLGVSDTVEAFQIAGELDLLFS
eukprot:g49722.t1